MEKTVSFLLICCQQAERQIDSLRIVVMRFRIVVAVTEFDVAVTVLLTCGVSDLLYDL